MHAKMMADKVKSLLFAPILSGVVYEMLAALGLLLTVFMIVKALLF